MLRSQCADRSTLVLDHKTLQQRKKDELVKSSCKHALNIISWNTGDGAVPLYGVHLAELTGNVQRSLMENSPEIYGLMGDE